MDQQSSFESNLTGAKLATEVIVVLIILVIILGVGLPMYMKVKDSLKNQQAKENLHFIQLSLERYAVDQEDSYYPAYLIGGSSSDTSKKRENVKLNDKGNKAYADKWINERIADIDPLMHDGYIFEYPRNPFVTSEKAGSKILDLQSDLADPYSSSGEGKDGGLRFGADGRCMGNVSADFRFPTHEYTDKNGKKYTVKTYADFDKYPMYDMATVEKPEIWLPGQFFYKPIGQIFTDNPTVVDPDEPCVPGEIYGYALGVYGTSHKRAVDVFGKEPKMKLAKPKIERSDQLACTNILLSMLTLKVGYYIDYYQDPSYEIPSWTRWNRNADGNGEYQGSPFLSNEFTPCGPEIGNPNGINDGVLMLLTGGT